MDAMDLSGFLHEFQKDDRVIEYVVSGAEHGEPVLLFYPMGTSRRLAALFDWPAKQMNARLISVNRPGKGRTSRAPDGQHLEQACNDAVACLDYLGIERVGILFMCAGAPFAFSFRWRFPERSTGPIAGCSTWVSPTDCPDGRLVYKMGASVPSFLLTAAAGVITGACRSIPMLPIGSFSEVGSGALSEGEAALFCETRSEDCEAKVAYLLETMESEAGGEGDDACVLLQGADAWGFTYHNLLSPVHLFHGEDDATVPIACAEWLIRQLPDSSVLYRIPKGAHGDVMLVGVHAALCVLMPKSSQHALDAALCVSSLDEQSVDRLLDVTLK